MCSKDPNVPLPMFQDAALKANWALQNIKMLDGALFEYREHGIRASVIQNQGSNGESVFRVEMDQVTIPIGLIVGDIVRNIRASLDYYISAIYRYKGIRDNNAYFTIGDDRDSLRGTIEGGLGKKCFGEIGSYILDHLNPAHYGP